MKPKVQKLILQALEGIKDELHGIRVALAEREKDTDHRLKIVESEEARHDRQIIALQRKVGVAG